MQIQTSSSIKAERSAIVWRGTWEGNAFGMKEKSPGTATSPEKNKQKKEKVKGNFNDF